MSAVDCQFILRNNGRNGGTKMVREVQLSFSDPRLAEGTRVRDTFDDEDEIDLKDLVYRKRKERKRRGRNDPRETSRIAHKRDV